CENRGEQGDPRLRLPAVCSRQSTHHGHEVGWHWPRRVRERQLTYLVPRWADRLRKRRHLRGERRWLRPHRPHERPGGLGSLPRLVAGRDEGRFREQPRWCL